MRARRALLYVPGDDQRKIHKAASLGASSPGVDCICLDLEDGVAWQRKEIARRDIPEALTSLDFGNAEKLVRVNAASSDQQADDLRAVLPAHPHGIVIPKVESPDDVIQVSQAVSAAETSFGWPAGEIGIIAIIESARAVVHLASITGADPRLQALAFGAEDFTAGTGAVRSREGWEVFYARSALVVHAAAYNLQAIDMVYVDLRDLAGLAAESTAAARLGFSGKQVIHPDQVGPVQRAFTPDEDAIADASRIVQAYEEQAVTGRSVFTLDGKMVEIPNVQAARRLLARANEGKSRDVE